MPLKTAAAPGLLALLLATSCSGVAQLPLSPSPILTVKPSSLEVGTPFTVSGSGLSTATTYWLTLATATGTPVGTAIQLSSGVTTFSHDFDGSLPTTGGSYQAQLFLHTAGGDQLMAQSSFTESSPNTNESCSSCPSDCGTCPAPTYPPKVSANGRYLVGQNGSPFLMVGDSPQALIGNVSETDAEAYFADRQAKGFNALWVNLLCSSYTFCNGNGTTYDGIAPFLSGSTPDDYDLSQPNPTYFARADDMLSKAAAHGILFLFDPIETGSWLVTLEHNGATAAFDYGVFIGNRYKNSPNIIWLAGNDFQDWAGSTSDNNMVKQVMAGIASVDSNHLQSIELDYWRSYSNQDTALSAYLGLDLAYTYYETYDEVLQAYNSTPVRPVFMGESNYEFEDNTGQAVGTAANLRRQEYWTLTSGATGQLYGNHYTTSGDWSGNLDTPGVTELQYATALFTAYPWWNLVPDQTHKVVTSGYGTYAADNTAIGSSDYATTAWVVDGSLVVTYCPTHTTLTVDMSQLKGPTTARWYDPTIGTFSAVAGSPFANAGTHAFSTPGTNHAGDSDWVLVLQ